MTDRPRGLMADMNLEKVFTCSFCGKSQKEVRNLIAGPTVYICNECIGVCSDIIAEGIDCKEAKPLRAEGSLASLVQAANDVATRTVELKSAWARSPRDEKQEELRLIGELAKLRNAAAMASVPMPRVVTVSSGVATLSGWDPSGLAAAEGVLSACSESLTMLDRRGADGEEWFRFSVTHALWGYCLAAVELQRRAEAVGALSRWRPRYLAWLEEPITPEETYLRWFDYLLEPGRE